MRQYQKFSLLFLALAACLTLFACSSAKTAKYQHIDETYGSDLRLTITYEDDKVSQLVDERISSYSLLAAKDAEDAKSIYEQDVKNQDSKIKGLTYSYQFEEDRLVQTKIYDFSEEGLNLKTLITHFGLDKSAIKGGNSISFKEVTDFIKATGYKPAKDGKFKELPKE